MCLDIGEMATQPKAFFCFTMSSLVEIFSTLITILVFVYDIDNDDTPWVIWTITSATNIVLLLSLSVLACPSLRKVYGQYSKMDNVSPFVVTAAVGYGYNFLAGDNPKQGWRIAAVTLYPILLWTIFSNLRVNLKYLPWTPHTIGLYRWVRYICVLIICINQALGDFFVGTGNDVSPAKIAFFVTTLALLYGMTAVVHFDGYKGVIAAHKKKLQESEPYHKL